MAHLRAQADSKRGLLLLELSPTRRGELALDLPFPNGKIVGSLPLARSEQESGVREIRTLRLIGRGLETEDEDCRD